MATVETFTFKNQDTMPLLGLGTWKAAPDVVEAAVKTAIEQGYRHLDCAPIYGNEAAIGRALADCFERGVVQRSDLWITSKLWNSAHAAAAVPQAIEKTLADLQLDYLDLYLIHWPVALRSGIVLPETAEDFIDLADLPLSETWRGMETVLSSGLCRHIGVANFSVTKLQTLLDTATIAPAVNQVECHPYLPQNHLLQVCQEAGILLTAYSPLGSGDRSSAFKAPDEPVLLADPVLETIASRHGCTPAQVLIAWALQRGTAVIPKSTNPQRLQENLTTPRIEFTNADLEAIASLDRHYRYVDGSFWVRPGNPYTLENLWDEES
jgi:alcohol dehydrogenase (NADP+)